MIGKKALIKRYFTPSGGLMYFWTARSPKITSKGQNEITRVVMVTDWKPSKYWINTIKVLVVEGLEVNGKKCQ